MLSKGVFILFFIFLLAQAPLCLAYEKGEQGVSFPPTDYPVTDGVSYLFHGMFYPIHWLLSEPIYFLQKADKPLAQQRAKESYPLIYQKPVERDFSEIGLKMD